MLDIRIPDIRRLESSIVEYENAEIETGKILFYGDSWFTRWKEKYGMRPMEDDIRMKDGSKAVVNHGFGSSTAEEQLFYYHRMVKPWAPRALVLRSSGNDRYFNYSVSEVMYLHARLIEYARQDFPGIRFFLCGAAPSMRNFGTVSWTVWQNYALDYNKVLKAYCAEHDDCTYVSLVDNPLFFENPEDAGDYKKVRQDIYIEDNVHLNQEGYNLFGELFRDVLKELL